MFTAIGGLEVNDLLLNCQILPSECFLIFQPFQIADLLGGFSAEYHMNTAH